MKRLQVGLIGYGFAGKVFHAPVISAVPGLHLKTVVQRSGDSAKADYPSVSIARSVEALYADDDIDLIVVATPSTNHYEVAGEALLAGKHVVVEKPFTTTAKEADELIALAKAQGRMISVYQNRRWDGDFQTVKAVVQQGLLGRIVEVDMYWGKYNPIVDQNKWRQSAQTGSGVFYDLGVHFIDQSLCLFGKPQAVTADIRAQREGAVADDFFNVWLDYADGLKVRMHVSLLTRQRKPRFALYGTAGSFVKYGDDPQEEALKAGRKPSEANWGTESKSHWGELKAAINGLQFDGTVATKAGAYQAYYQNIYDHLVHGEELAVKPEEARDAIALIELGFESSRRRQTIAVHE